MTKAEVIFMTEELLTEQNTSRGASTYWAVLKKRLAAEGANELLTNCKRLKMRARLESQLGHSVISPTKAADYLPPADRMEALPEDHDEE